MVGNMKTQASSSEMVSTKNAEAGTLPLFSMKQHITLLMNYTVSAFKITVQLGLGFISTCLCARKSRRKSPYVRVSSRLV